MLQWAVGDFRLLSLGCTATPLSVETGGPLGRGELYWMTRIVDVMMTAQSSLSTGMAQHLAGHENVSRINPVTPRGRYALDASSQIASLRGLGYAEARKALEQVRLFFKAKADPFAPFHTLS